MVPGLHLAWCMWNGRGVIFAGSPRVDDVGRRLRFATDAGMVVATIVVAISLGGLLIEGAYARETPNWATQALAQDWFDLWIAAPALVVSSLWAARGSLRGQLVLAGLLLYAVYTFAIYAFAVHLNALFLLYCAGLGVALYGVISLARCIEPHEVKSRCAPSAPRRAPALFLIVVGIAFGLLWLLQLIPAAITGREPAELAETGLLTNPVHVLDLSFILPLHVLAGIMLWRRRALGYVLAPVVLAFGSLMAASIGLLVIFMDIRGVTNGTLPLAIGMAAISVTSVILLARLSRALRDDD